MKSEDKGEGEIYFGVDHSRSVYYQIYIFNGQSLDISQKNLVTYVDPYLAQHYEITES